MTVVLGLLGLVALVQGVAWLGDVAREPRAARRRFLGALLAPLGLGLILLALGRGVNN